MTPALFERVQRLAEGFTGSVVELGSRVAEGQECMAVKSLFKRHTGIDVQAGQCVDIVRDVSDDSGATKGAYGATVELVPMFDLVLCLETLEHIPAFWKVLGLFAAMKPGATLMVSFPGNGFHTHRYPVDCYRFLPDCFPAIMTGFEITESGVLKDEIGQSTLYAIGIKL